ncbi:TetR/AcrR family transcriptional regulator [Goodfellowiella coeruleoviolacea]|uniref:Transcriptional regulator, TetR family n=1 Tax=Goodfellowiella coeruleoviolacea TaxID=334858 RepID=A0AAE3GEC8_9PSEU|nr:TetR/AcrR family transcriptional regulator [Goodfellowiella coeruleoviolacea]MCP2164578.1 transcriptional regulator, TetR family [Goodfellowiella coeruleoviolacea]
MNRKERAAETEAALKAAAKRLFATRGYLNTKITDITREAGRAAGSFYNHFASKEELLEALLADLGASGDEEVRTGGEHNPDFSDPAAVRFHVQVYWKVYREHQATIRALRQAALVNEDFARKRDEGVRHEMAELADHLDYVAELPATRELTMTMMWALIDGFAQARHDDLADEEAIEALTRFVYRGLNGRDY